MTKTAKTFDQAVAAKLATLAKGNGYDVSAVLKLADSIKGRTKTLDIDMHAAGVAAIHTSIEHGDTSAAAAVVNALGKHTRSKTMVAWFEAFSNIVLTFDKKADMWKAKLRPQDERINPDPAKAMANPFWVVEEKVPAGAFNDIMFAAAVAKLIKQATSATASLDLAGLEALEDLKALQHKLPVLAKAA